jgi:hypothetical protein
LWYPFFFINLEFDKFGASGKTENVFAKVQRACAASPESAVPLGSERSSERWLQTYRKKKKLQKPREKNTT